MNREKPNMNIPERHEDVTADWLTEALRSGGVIGEQAVTEFEVEPLGAELSRNSSLAKISLWYEGDASGLPDTMFAKFVSRVPDNRELASRFGLFQREIKVYKNLGSSIPLNIPKLYFGFASEESDVSILLMEEVKAVSKASLPSEQRPLTAGEAALGLNEMAKTHAHWWEDQALGDYGWLLNVDNDVRRQTYQSFDGAWSKLQGIMEPVFTPAELQLCHGLSSYLTTLLAHLDSIPVTLCHGDANEENLLWDAPGNPNSVWFVDWQFPARAPAVLDIAWFLGIGVNKSDLPFVRQDFLPAYHSELVNRGVTLYDFERFLNDYRYGLLDRLVRFIVLLSNLDLTLDESTHEIHLRVGNMAAAAEAAGCMDLIS
jgi:hypothetical protein